MIVGLTGGIGSGKTTVAKEFIKLNVPIYFADEEAKRLMHTSLPLKKGIKVLFGEEAYQDESLNKTFLAQRVFKDKYFYKN